MQCNRCEVRLVLGQTWTDAQERKKNYTCNSCRASYQREYHNVNKEARNAKQKERYKENKEAVLDNQKKYYLRKTFGISLAEYEEWMKEVCGICGKDEDKVLDHCHNTGDIRGTLCRQCNAALGLFKDDPELLISAAEWVNGD